MRAFRYFTNPSNPARVGRLNADRSGFLPLRFGRVRRIVVDVADLRAVQEHLKTRAVGADAEAVPLLFLPQARELRVPLVQPQHVAADRARRLPMHDDANVLSRLTTAEIELVPGPERDAAVVKAGRVLARVLLLRPTSSFEHCVPCSASMKSSSSSKSLYCSSVTRLPRPPVPPTSTPFSTFHAGGAAWCPKHSPPRPAVMVQPARSLPLKSGFHSPRDCAALVSSRAVAR